MKRFFVVALVILTSCSSTSTSLKRGKENEKQELHLSNKKIPILQGMTTASTTQIVLLLPKDEKFYIELEDGNAGTRAVVDSDVSVTRPFSKELVRKLKFTGLELKKTYLLKVWSGKSIVDFRALQAVDLKANSFRFAVASCMDDSLKEIQGKMWKSLTDKKPDFLFMIGDNVYADRKDGVNKGTADPQLLWERYTQTRLSLDFFYLRDLIPVLAVWDDHDYGMRDGDMSYEFKNESREIFETFFAQESAGAWLRGPGVSGWLTAFGQGFAFIDNRSFRTTKNSSSHEESHWGVEQEKWLFTHIKESSLPTWIIQGDQFFGAYAPFESFERNHPVHFKKVMKELSKDVEPVVFVSGDRHLIEYMKIDKAVLGYPTYELTTSAIHAKIYPDSWNESNNPRRIAGSGSHHNFAVIESSSSGKKVSFRLTGYGNEESVLFEFDHQVTR